MAKKMAEVVIAVSAIPGERRGSWCPSIRITGRADGVPFLVVQELYQAEYRTEKEAIEAGELAARAPVKDYEEGN